MNKAVDQILYDLIFKASQSMEYDTYEFNPVEGTNYPFVVIRDVMQSNRMTKTFRAGELIADIHIFGKEENRRQVSSMIHNLINKLRGITGNNDIAFYFEPESVQNSIIPDTTAGYNLWHGLIEAKFKYYIK